MATLTPLSPRRRYWEDTVFVPLGALGLGTVMVALGFAVAIALYVGDLFAGIASDPQQSQGVVAAFDKWIKPLMFLGASLLIATVVVTLRRIVKTIRYERGEAMKTHLPTLLTRGGN